MLTWSPSSDSCSTDLAALPKDGLSQIDQILVATLQQTLDFARCDRRPRAGPGHHGIGRKGINRKLDGRLGAKQSRAGGD